MADRKSHVGKSKLAREGYSRYIRRLDYEPTLEEPGPFKPSHEAGEESGEATSDRKRPVKISEKVKDHVLNNWINWLIGAAIVVMVFLMVDSKIDLAKINTTIDRLKTDVQSLIGDVKTINEKNHQQDLAIKEDNLRINSLEQSKEITRRK